MALFTAETARIYQAKGVESRKANKEAKANAPVLNPSITDSVTELYLADRLARVRLQLDRIDSMMLAEKDPQKLDRLASAQARLAEQERILSGRPLPGSLKPSSRQTRRAPGPSSPDLPQT